MTFRVPAADPRSVCRPFGLHPLSGDELGDSERMPVGQAGQGLHARRRLRIGRLATGEMFVPVTPAKTFTK